MKSNSAFRTVIVAFVLAGGTGAAGLRGQQPPAQPPHQHGTAADKSQAGMMEKCKATMAERDKMMAEMKEADQRLDTLVASMDTATGQQKTDAVAAVVRELVAQRKAMHERMMTMHPRMMAHMAEHMQAGKESLAMCPMMKDMGTIKH